MYQRFLVAGIGTIDIQTLFKYELCSYPTSLFDQKLLMRQDDKADLQNGLIKKAPSCITDEIPSDAVYVIDGGAFLQRLPWPKTASYADLTILYIQYVHNHFRNVLVVFDGYASGPSTKDETHQRRVGKEMSADVAVGLTMQMKIKKNHFWQINEISKGSLISLGQKWKKNMI